MRTLLAPILAALVVSTALGCSDPVDAPTDSGTVPPDGTVDSSVPTDSGEATDSGGTADGGPVTDAGTDAGTDGGTDAATPVDAAADAATDSGAGTDAAAGCHSHGYGAPAVTIMAVFTLPSMTGGAIPVGTYDAVGASTTGTVGVGGQFRATWVFEDADTLHQVLAIDLSSSGLPEATPRTYDYATTGATLGRSEVCPGTDTFDNGYRVVTAGGTTTLDIRQGGLMFTFQRR